MRRATCLMAFVVIGSAIVIQGATRKMEFTDDAVGQPPKGFEFGHTAKAGAPGKVDRARPKARTNIWRKSIRTTRARGFRWPSSATSPPPTWIYPCGSSRYRVESTRPLDSCGASRTRTTTTSSGRTRSRTTSCCTRSRTASAPISPLKGEGRTYGKKAQVPSGQWSTLRVVAQGRASRCTSMAPSCTKSRTRTFSQAGQGWRVDQGRLCDPV